MLILNYSISSVADPYQGGHIIVSLRLGFPLLKKHFSKHDAIILIFLEIKDTPVLQRCCFKSHTIKGKMNICC